MTMIMVVMLKTDLDKYVQRSVFRIPGVLYLSLPDNSGNEMIKMMMMMLMMMIMMMMMMMMMMMVVVVVVIKTTIMMTMM